MKNIFYFILKTPFVFGHVKKRFDQKDKVNFKICDITTWLTNNYNIHITIHILPDISRSKVNQTMKFGQVIKNNKRIIFLQKSCRK